MQIHKLLFFSKKRETCYRIHASDQRILNLSISGKHNEHLIFKNIAYELVNINNLQHTCHTIVTTIESLSLLIQSEDNTS